MADKKQTKEAVRDYKKGNPKNANVLEQLFPQGARVLNKINARIGFIFWAVAGVLAMAFILSQFWPVWGKIVKVMLVLGGLLLVYKVFLYNWAIFAWASESIQRAVLFTVGVAGLGIVFLYLKWAIFGIILLLVATAFGTAYFVRNKDTLTKSKKTQKKSAHRHRAHL